MTKPPGVITGRLTDRPVADLLESLHGSRRTAVARFRTALGTATVWFRDGELVDAEMGRFHQEAAVLRLLKIQDGEFEVELVPVTRRRTVKAATAQLLAEGRQRAPRPGPARPARPRATLSEPDAEQAAIHARRQVSSGRVRSAQASSRTGARAATPGPARTPTPGPVRTPTPVPGRRSPTPAGARTPTGPRTPLPTDTGPRTPLPTDTGPRTPLPSDSGAHTAIVPTPDVIPTEDELDVEEHPTIRARIPPGSELARRVRQSSDDEQTVVARATGVDGSVRSRRPSSTGLPAHDPTTGGEPSARPHRPEQRRPARAQPVVDDPSQSSGTGPSRASRRRAPASSWSPTAGGGGTKGAAEPPPPEPEPEPEPLPGSTGRTKFMFGVAGSPAEARAPRFGARPASDAEEPEVIDRTLMRPGPVPPPPTATPSRARQPSQPGTRRVPSGPIDVEANPAPTADPGETITYGTPDAIDEEYSHAISVPVAPSNVGPGGTWMLDGSAQQRPQPESPSLARPELDEADDIDKTFLLRRPKEADEPDDADKTFVLRQSDIPQEPPGTDSDPAKANPAGRTAQVGRYEVLLRLARGGMGTVYLCRITGEGGFRRLFALKVIREHLNRNQAYVDMLLEEARIASRLNHPNIVPILDIDTFAGQHFLVMDYVEGCTFSELLKAHPKSRPPGLVIPVIVDALTGLHAAHTMRGDDGSVHPLVHCDFSPQNMLVGMNGTCRISDFGVSKAADALPTIAERGKPRYLSPEQVRGLPVDPRSDVFSAGVVLWNALTGERVFDGATTDQILHQVVSAKVPKPSTVGLRPPACFDRVCLKALERDPDKRYQSAEQMLMDLRKIAIAQDMLAPSSEVGQWVLDTFGAQIERRRLAAGLGSEALAAGMAAGREAGPSGHSDGHAPDGSDTGEDLDASRTMMLRSGRPMPEAADEGLAPRTRMVVLVASFVFIAAGVATLFIRPDLLKGGMVDENHTYIEIGADEGAPPPAGDESGGATGGGPDAGTGGDTSARPAAETDVGDDSGVAEAGAEAADDSGDGTETNDGGSSKPARDGKGKGSKGKGSKDPKGKGSKDPKGKGSKDPKGDEPVAPPPDLDELFKQPGG